MRPPWAHAPSFVEVATYATDPQYFGIGSGPNRGDLNGSALRLLDVPTVDPHLRQMLRLCAFTVPAYKSARLLHVRQYQEIGQSYPQQDGSVFPVRFPVLTSQWNFGDGNIATMVRVINNPPPPGDGPKDFAKPLRASTDVYGVEPALLYVPDSAGGFGARYVPPMGGIPPGNGPGDLHIWHDISHPYAAQQPHIDVTIDGPALVTMWASVWQTDPATRGTRVLPDVGGRPYDPSLGLVPEDRFLTQSTQAIYTRVAGAMTFELFPTAPLAHTLYSTGESLWGEMMSFFERVGRPKGMGA